VQWVLGDKAFRMKWSIFKGCKFLERKLNRCNSQPTFLGYDYVDVNIDGILVLDPSASNVQNVCHFVLGRKRQQFVVTMVELLVNELAILLSIQCSMSFLWAIHLILEDFLNPLENIIKHLHL